ncbi:MAG: hypothetical protein OXN17_05085 [Candidatus Poribacteria bacterium]|nr:hypothetical protein [Candidatus Poribacteria bacterium]MDE0504820.1 hypothetical protein [Candidatus Poribacteria bacterium]
MMSARINPLHLLVLIGCLFMLSAPTAIVADYDYSQYSDRLSREHRAGNDVDEWIERGNATINASPVFEEGARLTAWASKYIQEDDYEFAIASAVYLFEIPPRAQYIEILVRYRGEPNEPYIDDYESIAGRVWIRNTKRAYTRRGYDDKHADETRYGDTFVLRSRRRSETIKIPAAGHVDDGLLEVHIVAQDGEQLDVEYVDVVTYRKQRHIHRYHRYARSYQWRPWHHYTYLYFYDGPCYYATDHGYYIRWSYPLYDRHYFAVRYSYGNYLHRYYTYHPTFCYRSYSNPRYVYSGPKSSVKKRRTQLNQWSQEHENIRRQYSRSRLSVARRANKQVNVQPRVRAVIEKHRDRQPVLNDHVEQNATISTKRERTSYRARSNTLRDRLNTMGLNRRSSVKRSSVDAPNDRVYSRGSAHEDGKRNRRIRSNSERRTQLYNRSKSYSGRTRVSSPRESNLRSGSKQKRAEKSTPSRTRSIRSTSPSQPSRSRVSAAPSRQSSSTSSNDDDDQNNRSSDRTRNTERTSRRRSR